MGKRLNATSFQLGHTTCAVDLRYAKEITDIPEIHPSQVADGHVIGNINLRWRTLPVIDFRGVIGNEEPFKHTAETLKNRKLLIFDLVES